MDKERNSKLMGYADEVLRQADCPLLKDKSEPGVMLKSFDGQISALGVSILTIGLQATMSVYYQDTNRRKIVETIARMLTKGGKQDVGNAEKLIRKVFSDGSDSLKTDILDCSVALKQVVRTYELKP